VAVGSPTTRGPVGGLLGGDRSWGFGLGAVAPRDGRPGRYGWEGGLGRSWSSSPRDRSVAILMTQRPPPSSDVRLDFWRLADE